MKSRIWELDALRGLCILGVIAVHLVYDVTVLYRLVVWTPPALFQFIQRWGGVLFLLISGICVTLGSRCVKRGLVVFSCGMLISAVTYGMYHFGFANKSIIIYFGVLHCLGICMLLWPIFRKAHWISLLSLGATLVAFGFVLADMGYADFPWLMPLGLPWKGFLSSDYFPLLPNLGFFLAGAAFGRLLYSKKETLLPKINARNPVLRFLCFCGKHSLWIYLLHQPILNGICLLLQTS